MTETKKYNKDQRIIQSLWIGSKLSQIEVASIQSFINKKHQFHLYVYHKVENVPTDVKICDANEIMQYDARYEISQGFGKGSKAPFADWFRFNLLLKKGGWWVDLDLICLKNLNDLPVEVVASSFEIPEGDCANCNVMSFPPGHTFLVDCIDEWQDLKPENYFYGMGVEIVKKVISKKNSSAILPHHVFNPVSYRHAHFIFSHSFYSLFLINIYKRLKGQELIELPTSKSHAIHLWNEMLRTRGIDKNQKFSPFSLFGKLKRRIN